MLVKKEIAHSMIVSCLAFSHNGKYLASGGFDDFLIIWEVETLKPLKSISITSSLVDLLYALDYDLLIV